MGYTVRQHGITPVAVDGTGIAIVGADGARTVFSGRPSGPTGPPRGRRALPRVRRPVALSDTAGSRVPGLSAEEYVRESILDPGAFTAAAPARGDPDGVIPRLDVSPGSTRRVAYLLPAERR